MEKSALSVLAFCLGAGGVAHAQEMVDLQNLQVLDEQRIDATEYEKILGGPNGRSSIITHANYDSNHGILTSANYDSNHGILTSANYDSNHGIITHGNYDSNHGILTAGNYSHLDPETDSIEEMPAPQAAE